MLISVIAPCRDEVLHVERFVREVLRQQLRPGDSLELLIADGRSRDGAREKLEALAEADGRVRLLDNPRGTTPAGLNIAIRQSRGAAIVRMDLHTSYADDYVAECVRALEETGADSVGGPWKPAGAGPVGEAIALAFGSRWVSGGGRSHDSSYEGEVDTVYLGCWRRDTLIRLGLFDEDQIRAQDSELNLRIWRSGGRIWQTPRIRSWYRPRERLRDLYRQYVQYGYWKIATLRKHKKPASIRQLVPGLFLGLLVALLLLSFVDVRAGYLAGLLLGAYGAGSSAAAAQLCRQSGRWDLFWRLPPVFAAFHCGFGYGYLRGILDFLVLRRRPARGFSRLTRGPAPARQSSRLRP
jgi:glycosyltransferase involved in cell wall biosynthesis